MAKSEARQDNPIQAGGRAAVSDNPRVNLEWKYMWCGDHLEPFRANWPNNAGIAMLNLFTASACDDRITAAAQGETARLEPVLREFGPMCCFLPADITQAVVEASLAGKKWEPAEEVEQP